MKFNLFSLFILLISWQCVAIEPPESKDVKYIGAAYLVDKGFEFSELQSQNWLERKGYVIPKDSLNLWLKFNFELQNPESNGLFLSLLGSHKLYWDGHVIGGSGQIASNNTEVPGQIDNIYRVPDQLLTVGEHEIIVQISRHHLPPIGSHNVIDLAIAPLANIQGKQADMAYTPFFFLGSLFIIALFSFALSFGKAGYRNYVSFGLLCILVSALLITENWRPLWGYSYDFHLTRLLFVALFTLFIGLVLPWTIWSEYQVRHKLIKLCALALGYVSLLIAIPSFDLSALLIMVIALTSSLLPMVKLRTRLKFEDDLLALSLLLNIACAMLLPDFMESWFFLLFGSVLAASLYKLAQKMKSQNQLVQRNALNNEKLKLELVKKHIQPHFLMNTLTCLSEWIETSPATAQDLIDALAEEFRLLISIVDKTDIDIMQELALCNLHLQVMSLRQDKQFILNIEQQIPHFRIPPGILHTVIENTISHISHLPKDVFEIALRIKKLDNNIQIKVTAPFADTKKVSGIGLGTGRKYILTRLNSYFSKGYALQELEENENWHTVITFPAIETHEEDMI